MHARPSSRQILQAKACISFFGYTLKLQVSMSSRAPPPSFVACVVGLSSGHGEPFNWKPGIGKSCLCHRFAYPGFDDYFHSHPSVLALHEFESHVINSDHFLYWGSPERCFHSTDRHKTVSVKVHVLEQTLFYQDVTCQPFTMTTRPDHPEAYLKRITGTIESPGKLSYRSRDDIVSPADYNASTYPTGISKLSRGYVVVVDVSQKEAVFDQQLHRAEKIVEYLTKHKKVNVIAATKRDRVVSISLEKVYELKKKYKTQIIEVSSEQNYNVDEVFRYLAYKLVKSSKLSSQIQTYPEAAHNSLSTKGSAKRSFVSFIQKRILDPDHRINVIERNDEYVECCSLVGKFETERLFAMHLIEVYDKTLDMSEGVKDNPDMREEELEDYVGRRSDLELYSNDLKE